MSCRFVILLLVIGVIAVTANSADIAVLTCGSSGSGKSFLDNLMLGREAFSHRISATSVTRKHEVETQLVRGRMMAFHNIPGLLEGNLENVPANIAEIQR
jgi:predicted GTPase